MRALSEATLFCPPSRCTLRETLHSANGSIAEWCHGIKLQLPSLSQMDDVGPRQCSNGRHLDR